MSGIDFVPTEYVQQRESTRANFLYLIIFGVMMGAIGITFSLIKVRQHGVDQKLAEAEARMAQAQEQIAQLEALKVKGRAMMRTMQMTSELLEPVPRSVILACLSNNLPNGVSLLRIKLSEKETAVTRGARAASSQYNSASKSLTGGQSVQDKQIVTNIEIEGIAPSDIEVASYIAHLSESVLFGNVQLIESKEHKIDNVKFRDFKLSTVLKKRSLVTKEDIATIRAKGRMSL